MRKRDIPRLLFCAFGAASLVGTVGCSYPLRVESNYGPAIKLSDLGPGFAWRPGFESTWGDRSDPSFETKSFIRDRIVAGLEARGFHRSAPAAADFWVDYRFSTDNRGGLSDQLTQNEMSMLVLHVIDPVSRQGIWRGWAESRLPGSATPEQHRKEIGRAVEATLRLFPYKPGCADRTAEKEQLNVKLMPRSTPATP